MVRKIMVLSKVVRASLDPDWVAPNVDRVLDYHPSTIMAGGLKKIKSSYSGSCCQVRRASDNSVLDIGFDAQGDDVDTAAIAAFCGVYDGFVPILYDQNTSNNFVQTTAAHQAKIYDGTTAQVYKNAAGRPTMKFINDPCNYIVSGYTPDDFSVCNMVVDVNDSNGILLTGNNTTRFAGAYNAGQSAQISTGTGAPTLLVNSIGVSTTRDALNTALKSSTPENIHVVQIRAMNIINWGTLNIGRYASGAASEWEFQGDFSEVIFYKESDLSLEDYPLLHDMVRTRWAGAGD